VTTLGIVGGIGPESTIDYYGSLVATWRRRKPDGSYPRILINSIDVTHVVGLINAGDLAALTAFLATAVRQLAAGGAGLALLAANTPHLVFGDVAAASPIPMISIVETTCAEARQRGMQRVALLGTRFTMEAGFYPALLRASGIEVVTPEPEERDYIHDKYMRELLVGSFLPETRERLIAIIEAMKTRHGIDGVILGGTELPLILRGETCAGVPLLDTTRLHVEAAVERMLA
jgi:aspartate racemase